MRKILAVAIVCFAVVLNLHADNEMLYIKEGANIEPMKIDPINGAVIGGVAPLSTTADDLIIDPLGRFLYETSTANRSINAYSIDDTGSLTFVQNVFPTPVPNPVQLAIDPFGRYLFVMGSTGVASFSINSATGAL